MSATLTVIPDGIAPELKTLPQWVCWQLEERGGESTKVPKNARTGTNASSTNPATWVDFDTALAYAESHSHIAGIGFVLSADTGVVGVDIDKCRDPITGELTDAARETVELLGGSWSISPSGTGLRWFGYGELPERLGDGTRIGGFEAYKSRRFLTVTGKLLDDEVIPLVAERDDLALDAFCNRRFPAKQSMNGHKPQDRPQSASALSDDEVIQRARDASNGGRFRRLFEQGDTSEYDGDDSRADQALSCMLAFWCSDDASQIDRVFRRSALYREKWERADYRDRTIAKAIENSSERYAESGKVAISYGHRILSDTTPVSVSERILKWTTAREVAERVPEHPDWILPGFLAVGAVTELDGPAKSAGKTTWATHLSKAILTGGKFLERQTVKSTVIYLTEQTPSTMREPLRRADLLEHDDLHLLHWHDTDGLLWPEIVDGSHEKAMLEGARVLIVDTLPQFAGLKGDSENHSGASLEAMKPIQLAAANGLAVLIIRHDRKSGGEVGESARGSSAYTGSVDIVVQISRGKGQTRPGIRELRTLSRFDETPDEMVIELTEEGYICHGDGMAVRTAEATKAILEALPRDEGVAMSEIELTEASGVSRTLTRTVLLQLVEAHQVTRVGKGKRGSPYRYWIDDGAEMLSDTLKAGLLSERISGHEQTSLIDAESVVSSASEQPEIHSDTNTTLRVSERNTRNLADDYRQVSWWCSCGTSVAGEIDQCDCGLERPLEVWEG